MAFFFVISHELRPQSQNETKDLYFDDFFFSFSDVRLHSFYQLTDFDCIVGAINSFIRLFSTHIS